MLLRYKKKISPPDGYLYVQSAKQLLSSSKCKLLVKQIQKSVALPQQEFDRYYLYSIERYAEFVQLTPASEFNHHAYPGGLLEHTLEVIDLALKRRKGILMPAGVTAEHEPEVRDVYTYGVFCSALCHDLAKPTVDQRIHYLKEVNRPAERWCPFSGCLADQGAKYFKIEFVKHRDYKTHAQSSMLFVHRVLSPQGLSWLQSNQDVFKQFVALLSGQQELGEIAAIIKQADQRSTSKALGAQQAPTFTSEKPLFLKIKSTLRVLIADGRISLNRKGANGWVAHDHVWILAKIAVDKVREQLEVEGHGSVPTDNSRMFDIMMDHGLIQSNPNGDKAIWKIHVETLDWKPTNDFSVVKVPLNIAFATDTDSTFDGIVTILEGDAKTSVSPKAQVEPVHNEMMDQSSEAVEPDQLDPHGDILVAVTKETVESKRIKAVAPDAPVANEEPVAPLYDGTDPVVVRQNLGTDFFFWVKESLSNQAIAKNTSDSFLHNTKEGLLLVSPKIFKEYSEHNSLSDWVAVQKSFQALRLNLKTPGKGENTFKVRVSGKRKISMLQCWIIPHNEFDGCPLPKVNSHLDILDFKSASNEKTL